MSNRLPCIHSLEENVLLFKVTAPDGSEFVIHTNGTIRGFPVGSSVRNRYPSLLRSFAEASSSPTAIRTADGSGREHSVPECLETSVLASAVARGEK